MRAQRQRDVVEEAAIDDEHDNDNDNVVEEAAIDDEHDNDNVVEEAATTTSTSSSQHRSTVTA